MVPGAQAHQGLIADGMAVSSASTADEATGPEGEQDSPTGGLSSNDAKNLMEQLSFASPELREKLFKQLSKISVEDAREAGFVCPSEVLAESAPTLGK